jgi:uncharacterized protein YlaI
MGRDRTTLRLGKRLRNPAQTLNCPAASERLNQSRAKALDNRKLTYCPAQHSAANRLMLPKLRNECQAFETDSDETNAETADEFGGGGIRD